MKKQLIITAVTVLTTISVILSQSESPFEHSLYWPEAWRGRGNSERAPYWGDIPPDTGLWGETSTGLNEPPCGYPMTSGIVVGISDTFEVAIELKNDNQSALDVSSYTISDWFEPIVYDLLADVREDAPLTLPSSFGWQFAYWLDYRFDSISQPSLLKSRYDYTNDENYILVYHLWGLPAGRLRVMMDTTSNAPPWFRLIVNVVKPTWIVKPITAKDSINAYVGCIWRAFQRNDLSAASTFVNQILSINPSSIPGYAMKAMLRDANSDSLGYLAGLDSVNAIMERYGDPLLPDSSEMGTWTYYWYHDMLNLHQTKRWELINNKYPWYE